MKITCFILLVLIVAFSVGGQVGMNGVPKGLVFIDPKYADGSTPATSVIQAALSGANTSEVRLTAPGTYLIGDINIPDGVSLVCQGVGRSVITLAYTGSGSAITGTSATNGKGKFEGCILHKQGTLGGVGVDITIGFGFEVHNTQITNFSQCIFARGQTAPGNYFMNISNNFLDTCTNGIDSNGTLGGNTTNSIVVANNIIHHVNKGINVCAGCQGWNLIGNDIELPTGNAGCLYCVAGPGNILSGNWAEYGTLGGATNVTGISVTGIHNVLIGNVIANSSGVNFTATNIAAGNMVLDLYDFSSGATAIPDIRLPHIAGGSNAPTVDASGCTGATIGAGSTNLAGTITGLPTGACSVKITFDNATVGTGWSCAVSDITTGNLFRQTASTTTSATFAGTSVSGDVLAYGPCAGY